MSFRAGFRRHVGFLTLFTVLTSSSLNTLTFARIRREERKLHALQCTFLEQLYRNVHATPSSSRIGLEEQSQLARRIRALQLDPLELGISPNALPSAELQERARLARLAETSWAQALFGAGTFAKVRKALGRAYDTIRGRETALDEDALQLTASEEADDLRWTQWIREMEGEEVTDDDKAAGKNGEAKQSRELQTRIPQGLSHSGAQSSKEEQQTWYEWALGKKQAPPKEASPTPRPVRLVF